MVALKRKSLTEQIQEVLIDRILKGELVPGDRLKELQIANEFGTSQAPVRETIRSLQAMGYVEHKPHVGAIVKKFTRKEIEEAYQVREALEGHCLTITDVARQDLIDRMSIQLDKMYAAKEKNDIKLFIQADNLFHRAIIECSDNVRMLEIWDSLKMQMQVIATHVEALMSFDTLYDLHPPIVEALKNRDRDLAKQKLANHYRIVEQHWIRTSE